MLLRWMPSLWLVIAASFAVCSAARADVERIEVLERGLVAEGKSFGNVGPYERLRGRIYYSIEAGGAENQAVADIKLVPRDSQGHIRFAADFVLLKPADPARANGRLLYDVANRGTMLSLQMFNDGAFGNVAATAEQAGNGFLMEQGYAILATGWSWDVPLGGDRLRADIPMATEGGDALDGLIAGEITPLAPATTASFASPGTLTYEPAKPDDANARLTVRDAPYGPRTLIARDHWQFGRKIDGHVVFDPTTITLNDGFKPGLIYTVTYAAHGSRVVGLGLASIRDALLFFRHERADRFNTPNPLIEHGGDLPRAVIAFGHSQSGRLLQTMIADGLAADDRGRLAFDGALISGGGAGGGSFNVRFGQTGRRATPDTELDFPTDMFPFTSTTETDPVTNQSGSVLDRAEAANAVPKIIYVNSSTEYWARGASLLHTSVDGKTDIAADRRVRVYLVAGGFHAPGFPLDQGTLSRCRNPLDHRPFLRALLLHLDGWVTLRKEPPPSMVPTLSDSSLGKLADYLGAEAKIPGLRTPTRFLEPPRLDFGPGFDTSGIATVIPPKVGKAYSALVPMPDSDGTDKAGVRMPEVAVPLGTYTGWNLFNAATGAPDRLNAVDGSFIPFARNENERIASSDPRPSIAERYPKRDSYIEAYAAAALNLANKELIVGADINGMVERAGRFYDRVMARDPSSESCAYLSEKKAAGKER